ncbi:hypothetical protein ACWCXL_12085 [Streptomyces sp. NPDC001588]
MTAWNAEDWTPAQRVVTILAYEINDGPASELFGEAADDVRREWAANIRALGTARGWSTWAADYMHPDVAFVDTGNPTSRVPAPSAVELLPHASMFEIPRSGDRLALLLKRSYGHSDRWAILDRRGNCWDRAVPGWVPCTGTLEEDKRSDSARFTLVEAWPLAVTLAADSGGEQP